MKKPSFELLNDYTTSQNVLMMVGYVLICLMMVTIAVGFSQLGNRLFPDWQGSYLVVLGLLISMESIYTRKQVRELDFREKVIFRLSEWVAFMVAIKLLLYAINGFDQLLRDLPLWQESFGESFFTPEYIVALLITLVVWLSSAAYAGELEELHQRENDAAWDELGKLTNALQAIRMRITTRVFALGTLVVVLAVLSRVDATFLLRERGIPTPGYTAPVANVLVYFLLALVLLSTTQFALLRTRWLWQRVPISPKIAGNWVRFGLAFFLVLAVLAFFLPTEYSLGLFDTLRIVGDFFMQFMSALMFLLMLPFTLCMSLFSLAGGTQATREPAGPIVPPPTTPTGQPFAWLEFIRSLAFWVIFLAIVFFALRYYLGQNKALLQTIRAFPLTRWLSSLWDGIRAFFRGANRQITGLVQESMKRLRAQRAAAAVSPARRFFNLKQMSPREKVIHFYVSLVNLGGERGLERRPSQTPYQYEDRLGSAIPEVDQDLHSLTDTFLEARYSRHAVEETQAEQANSLWERIKAALRGWRRSSE